MSSEFGKKRYHPEQFNINGTNILVEPGITRLLTNCDVICERDLNYFKTDHRLPDNTEILVDHFYWNFYGDHIVAMVDGREFYIKPINLKPHE